MIGGITAQKAYCAGTHRILPPVETVARVDRLKPALGITRVANVTGLDTIGIPVVMVCRPNSRSLAVSQGKGVTLEAATASGLMESLELFHAERVSAPLRLESYQQLRHRVPVVDIDRLPRLADGAFSQYLRILWIEATDLLSGESAWVPFELVDLDCAGPALPGAGSFFASSNGLASGNHIWEATIHAICEVIERDALSRFEAGEMGAKASRRLSLDSITNPVVEALLQLYSQAAMRVQVWEMTTDVGIPCFKCAIAGDPSVHAVRRGTHYGMGCHPSRTVALSRALTEAAQARLTVIAGSRDDLTRSYYQTQERLDRDGEEWTDWSAPAPVDYVNVPTWESADLERDADWILERLQTVGIESVLLIDHTVPALGIPVVRAIIPGMQGIGRLLYDPAPTESR